MICDKRLHVARVCARALAGAYAVGMEDDPSDETPIDFHRFDLLRAGPVVDPPGMGFWLKLVADILDVNNVRWPVAGTND